MQGRTHLLGDETVILSQEVAPLGMADDDIAHSKVQEHGGGNLTGVGAALFPVHVLGPQPDPATSQGFSGGGQGGKGGADQDLHPGQLIFGLTDMAAEGRRFGGGFMHLPVGGDDQVQIFHSPVRD